MFYYITYEGAVDIERIADPRERRSMEAQINEFGQTPHQLFHKPHPPRSEELPAPVPLPTPTVASPSPVAPSIAALDDDFDVPQVESLDLLLSPVRPSSISSISRTWPKIEKFNCEFSYKLHRE